MMCEECGANAAKFHLVTIINGAKVERSLCPECMAKQQKKISGIDFSGLAGMLGRILEAHKEGEKPEPEPEYEDLACDRCGMTYKEFRKGGMLGCADCYKSFKAPLTALMQRIHGHTEHAGRVPRGLHSDASIRMNIERLRQKLQRAVADEEYEQAARLRDAIRALNVQLEHREADIKVRPQERLDSNAGGGEDA